MENVYYLKIDKRYFLMIVIIIIITQILSGCSELPSKSEGPDNPLDPRNPANKNQGPVLVLSPTQINVNSGNNFQLELWIVETDSIAGLSTRISYDPQQLSVEEIDSLVTASESILLQNGGQLIFFSDVDTDSGFIDIDCAVVEGKPRNITGSGIITRINFRHLSGTSETNLEISENSLLRDDSNTEVALADRIGSQINIK